MKKDIERLKEKVDRLFFDNSMSNNPYLVAKREAITEISNLIDQIDEPEVLSKKWIDEHEIHYDHWVGAVPVTDLQNLLVPKQEEITEEQAWRFIADNYNQDEAYWWDVKNHYESLADKVVIEKPVIPKFVAEWIEKWKSEGLTMSAWFTFDYDDEDENKVAKWLYNNDDETNKYREFMLIDAIRYGYEVEKEPPYYVAFDDEISLLYVTRVDIYGENGKCNYNSEFDKKHALKFTDKSRAEYLADFLGATVVRNDV